MKIAKVIAVTGCLFIAGCASTMNAVFRRPMIEDEVSPNITALSMDASRRVVFVHHYDGGMKLCAEPPPDVADKITTALELGLKGTTKSESGEAGAEASLKDSFALDAVKLSERSIVSDIFRTASYSLCQYHVNGAIGVDDFKIFYADLIERTFNALTPATPTIPKPLLPYLQPGPVGNNSERPPTDSVGFELKREYRG